MMVVINTTQTVKTMETKTIKQRLKALELEVGIAIDEGDFELAANIKIYMLKIMTKENHENN